MYLCEDYDGACAIGNRQAKEFSGQRIAAFTDGGGVLERPIDR